jgi:hypothetical protein
LTKKFTKKSGLERLIQAKGNDKIHAVIIRSSGKINPPVVVFARKRKPDIVV